MSDNMKIGEVLSGAQTCWYRVYWNAGSRKVYCETHEIGLAGTAREAMHVAAAWATRH